MNLIYKCFSIELSTGDEVFYLDPVKFEVAEGFFIDESVSIYEIDVTYEFANIIVGWAKKLFLT